MVEIYRGTEIGNNQIETIRNIAYRRYSKNVFDEYFSNIHDVKDLARLHSISVDDEILIIGKDWFLCYTESVYYVQVSEWILADNDDRLQQTVEMMNVLKKILIQNRGKLFCASMRHDTSYQIYLKMLENNYFKELRHNYIIDCSAPQEVAEIKEKLSNSFDNMEEFLSSEKSRDYEEYLTYILHQLNFIVTHKFEKKCKKLETNGKKVNYFCAKNYEGVLNG